MPVYFSFVVGLVVTMVLIPPLMRYADILKLVDVPDSRKMHSGRIPRVGGVAIVIASVLPIVLWDEANRFLISYISAVGVLFVFGILDDRGDLDYRWKFLGQFIAAGIIVIGGDCVIGVVPFFGFEPVSEYVSIPLTIIALVGITNAINLADGLDGLAAGTTILSLSAIALLAYIADGYDVVLMSVAICGSLIGFLRFNTYPARVFMGDTGSQFLGFSAAVLAITLTQVSNPALNPGLPLLILGLPILDTFLVMAKRIKEGRSPFSPDRNHIHHQLLGLGLDHNQSVAVVYIIQGIFVSGAILMRYYSDSAVVLTYAVVCFLITFSIVYAGRSRRGRTDNGNVQFKFLLLPEKLRNNRYVYLVVSLIIKSGVILFLLAGSLSITRVPPDLAVAASVLALVMLVRLIVGYRLWFLPLRLFVYVSAAFVVYMVEAYTPQNILFTDTVQAIFFSVIAGSFLIVIHNTREERFTVTTTDLLVLFMTLAIIILPVMGEMNLDLSRMLLKLIVLFYACEMMIGVIEKRWNVFVISSFLALSIISLRGIMHV